MTFVSGPREPQLLDMIDRAVTALEKIAEPLSPPEKSAKVVERGLYSPLPSPNDETVSAQELHTRVEEILRQVNKASRSLIDDRDRMKAPTKLGETGGPMIPRDSRLYFETVTRIEVLNNIGSHLRYALGMNDENPRFV